MPLRVRLAMLFSAATGVAIALAGTVFVLQLRVSVDASLDPGLRAQVAEVADEVGSASGMTAPFGPADTLVQVWTLDGTLLATSPGSPSTLLTPSQQARAVTGELSFSGVVGGDCDRILATTAATGRGRLLILVGTGTDVSEAAVDRAVSALVVGGRSPCYWPASERRCGRSSGCVAKRRPSSTGTWVDASQCRRPAMKWPPSGPP